MCTPTGPADAASSSSSRGAASQFARRQPTPDPAVADRLRRPDRGVRYPGSGVVEISDYAEGETVSREDVAAVIAAILTGDAASGVTFELASGHTPIPEALVKL